MEKCRGTAAERLLIVTMLNCLPGLLRKPQQPRLALSDLVLPVLNILALKTENNT